MAIGRFAQEFATVLGLPPQADAFATAGESDVVNATDAEEVIFRLLLGAAADNVNTITVEACDDVTPSNSTAIPFTYVLTSVEGSPGALTAATAAGVATDGDLAANQHYTIMVDPADIEAASSHAGRKYVRLVVTEGGTATAQLGAIDILVRTKRRQEQIASVIA
jgi:hypothetical protein